MKYYPEAPETSKGHLNQTWKNVRSTKPKAVQFEEFQSPLLKGHKLQDIYTTVYDVRNTIFTDQTGKFPHCSLSLSGNNYLMVLVEIDSSAILVEPIKSRSDTELIHAYSMLMSRLHKAGLPRANMSLTMKSLQA